VKGDELMTVDQMLVELGGVSRRTFYRWREIGHAPAGLKLPNAPEQVEQEPSSMGSLVHPAFEHDIRGALAALRTARGTYGLSLPEECPDLFEPAIAALDARLDRLDELVTEAALQASRPQGVLLDLAPASDAVRDPLENVSRLLRQHCRQDRYYIGNAGRLYGQISAIRSAVTGLKELYAGRAWRSFAATAILVTGTGGAGKTHLLCDLARSRAANGQPTIIALGEQFERGPIEADLGRIIGFHSPAGQLLATFEVACQTSGEIGLIIIDGLNEPTDRGHRSRRFLRRARAPSSPRRGPRVE
jgi:hypothetical protein